MAILQDDDVRFRHLSRKIGVFLLIAAAGIVLVVVSIGIQQEVFVPKTLVSFVTDSGRDITQGMAVKLSGFNIGKVKKLALTEKATVKVTLEINDEYMKWVRQDSKARLLKEGVIGDNIIEIIPSAETSPKLAKDALIEFERERGMGQVIDDLQPLIADLRSVVRHADTFVSELPATRARLDAVLASAQRNFENLEKVTRSDLPAAVRGGKDVVESSKKVVDSVGRTWPFNSGNEPPKSGVLPLDSYGSVPPKGGAAK
jgi:phospholipid/cholesterol/gamma-HCH transport system substrate-binding protein